MTNTVCVCGHEHEAHEHFRRGTDCGTCGAEVCPKFRKAPVQIRPATPAAPAADPAKRDNASRRS